MASTPQVTWADQQNINTFGRFHTRSKEVDQELDKIDADLALIKDTIDDIETLLDDDGCVKIKIGEIFFEVNNEEGVQLVQKILDKKTAEKEVLIKEQEQLQVELNALKKELYAKFGDSIHLD